MVFSYPDRETTKYVPIESVIKDNQEEYYNAIAKSTGEGKSNAFIEFMLRVIDEAIKDIVCDTREHYNHISIQVNKLMKVLLANCHIFVSTDTPYPCIILFSY